jgi:hypothetical protein
MAKEVACPGSPIQDIRNKEVDLLKFEQLRIRKRQEKREHVFLVALAVVITQRLISRP